VEHVEVKQATIIQYLIYYTVSHIEYRRNNIIMYQIYVTYTYLCVLHPRKIIATSKTNHMDRTSNFGNRPEDNTGIIQ